jgi:hypothetical protein
MAELRSITTDVAFLVLSFAKLSQSSFTARTCEFTLFQKQAMGLACHLPAGSTGKQGHINDDSPRGS